MEITDDFDLNQMDDRDIPLGWCRALLPPDENLCWAGLTRVRPTRIALYDLANRKMLREFSLECSEMDSVFSILPVAPPGSGQAGGGA